MSSGQLGDDSNRFRADRIRSLGFISLNLFFFSFLLVLLSSCVVVHVVCCRDVRNEQDAQFAAALSTRAPILSAIPAAASASASASSPSPSSSSTPSSPLYRWNLIADPGIGFAKTGAHAVQLLRRLGEVRDENQFPLLVGASRKGFISHALRHGQQVVEARHQHDGVSSAQTTTTTSQTAPPPLEDRDWGTGATVVASIMAGANIVRVHDVHAMRCVRDVADQIYRR